LANGHHGRWYDLPMNNETRKSLSTGQAAKLIGCNSKTVRRWVDLGKLEGFKTPTNLRYVYQDKLDEWLNNKQSN